MAFLKWCIAKRGRNVHRHPEALPSGHQVLLGAPPPQYESHLTCLVMGVVKCGSSFQVKFHDNCFLIHLFAFNHKNSSPEHRSKPRLPIWRPKDHWGQHNGAGSKRRSHSQNDNKHPSSGGQQQRGRQLFCYLYREKNMGGLRSRSQWWKQSGTQNLHPSLHRHRSKRAFPFRWKITCSRNSLDTKMGDACKKKMALYNILYIFNCFTDSRPTIFYSLKDEDAER